MSERTLREELQELLTRAELEPFSSNGGAVNPVVERNLRLMLQATYGLAEESLTPAAADAMLTTLLGATDGSPVASPEPAVASNGHPSVQRPSSPLPASPRLAVAPVTTPLQQPRTWQRRSWRLAVLLAILLALATVAGAMWVRRCQGALEVRYTPPVGEDLEPCWTIPYIPPPESSGASTHPPVPIHPPTPPSSPRPPQPSTAAPSRR